MFVRRCSLLVLSIIGAACSDEPTSLAGAEGCPESGYSPVDQSDYVIPFTVGTELFTGLANCSASFHAAGNPDEYATDFDLPMGTPFVAARPGVVTFIQEDQPSLGGGDGEEVLGNAVFVAHRDGTTALYLHSPLDGITVELGDTVAAGDTLGLVGASGLAGYPHLHFIVVEGDTSFPYRGVPVTFRNASPPDVPLRTYASYTVDPY
ncbi:MAG: M23 family metallopeptidase [Gemmatimonadetes bacterium]|nr:M23 family metallopeptidase [Gemmatimonadota bacterium]